MTPLANDPNGYTPDEYRDLTDGGWEPHVRRTGWLSGADPVVTDERPEWGPQTLAEAREDLEAAYKVYDMVVEAQHAAIRDRNKAREDAAYQTDRARYWADLANERQGEINRLRAELNRITGG